MTSSAYLEQALALAQETTALRRRLHGQPEPSNAEFATHRLLREELAKWQIPYEAPADNITVAAIKGAQPGRTSAARCDTDALEVQEENQTEYRSQKAGLMHACGHDAHMAMGICAARLLQQNAARLAGTAKIVFQPAEEGGGGAVKTIQSGCVQDIQAMFGLHVWPQLPTGTIAISPGAVAASTDRLVIDFSGVGGHGAYPELCHDALVAAAYFITQAQAIVARMVPPMEAVVLSIGSCRAGSRWNIIAGSTRLEGTLRTFSLPVRKKVLQSLRQMAEATAQAHGCSATVELAEVCKPVVNDPDLARIGCESAQAVTPNGECTPQQPSMIGDDFCEFSAIAPGCYGFLGVAGEGMDMHPLHHAAFCLDEAALPVGAAWLCEAMARFNRG